MAVNVLQYLYNNKSRHSNTEHRASTRILHLTLFLASTLISAQVLLIPLASWSTVLRHVFFGLPLPRLPCGFHSRACLAMSSDDFRSVWPSHPHLRFLICKSMLSWFVRFHSALFVIWSGQKITRKSFIKLQNGWQGSLSCVVKRVSEIQPDSCSPPRRIG